MRKYALTSDSTSINIHIEDSRRERKRERDRERERERDKRKNRFKKNKDNVPISREIKNKFLIDIETILLCIFLTATHMCEIPGIFL